MQTPPDPFRGSGGVVFARARCQHHTPRSLLAHGTPYLRLQGTAIPLSDPTTPALPPARA